MMDSRNTSNATHNASANNNPMFSPASPLQPQSPTSQLTMQLLGSLMQMQGLDNNFPMQSNGFPNAPSSNMNFGAPQFGNSMNMGSVPNTRANPSDQGFGNPQAPLLEQQIKLQQLQQLQQLQNQIFQQQVRLPKSQLRMRVLTPSCRLHLSVDNRRA